MSFIDYIGTHTEGTLHIRTCPGTRLHELRPELTLP